jgi:hypothetical protein
MSPRLQGELAPDGTLTLSVWGAGEVGRLKLEGLDGPLVVGPNRIETADGGGLFAAQSAPAVALRGARPTYLWPSGAGGFIAERRGAD